MLKRARTTRFAIGSVLFIVFTMGLFVSCAKDSGTTSSPPAEPDRFTADAEKRLLELNLKYSRADWVKSTYISEDTELLSAEANKAVIEATTELAKEARRFEGQNLTPDVQRKLKLLKLALVLPAPTIHLNVTRSQSWPPLSKATTARVSTVLRVIRESALVSASWKKFSRIVGIPRS